MSYPKISIITVSYNQGQFIERTILSVLSQNYPNLEYIIIDGGSTDGSADIIKKYDDRIAYWCSEPDKGQYHAINKGFAKSTGDILGFLNADDVYFPWTLSTLASLFTSQPHIEWITSLRPSIINTDGVIVASGVMSPVSKKAFVHGLYVPGEKNSLGVLVQEGTFWKRSLWQNAGSALNTAYKLAADFDLWSKFTQHAELYGLGLPLAAMTRHAGQRSNQIEEYRDECKVSLQELHRSLGYSTPAVDRHARLTLALKKNRFTWALGRRLLNYDAWVVNPELDVSTYALRWQTVKLRMY